MLDIAKRSRAFKESNAHVTKRHRSTDVYFSADVETDGPIPGPFSMLSFSLVYCGEFNGKDFSAPRDLNTVFYQEMKPISEQFEKEALRINGLDRAKLAAEGTDPATAMQSALEWVTEVSNGGSPVLVAYPVSFDWTWLFWYFTAFCKGGSPFNYSRCYDLKTAISVKARIPINRAGRSKLPLALRSTAAHTHNALDDAREQAEIFIKSFNWSGE